jgi:archaellum biogenesis ATPase FlaH
LAEETLSQHVQDCIIKLSIVSETFLKHARLILQPYYFRSKYSKALIQIAFDYWDLHKKPIGDHFSDELLAFFNHNSDRINKSERKIFVQYANKIRDIKNPNISYILRRTNNFVRATEFELAALKFVELTEKGKFEQARELMLEKLRLGISRETVGTSYYNTDDLETRNEEFDPNFLCPTGIDRLDRSIKGIYRGRFYLIAGIYKGGKSFFLQTIAREALKHGLKVLHISHELTEEELKERYDMVFGGLTEQPENEIYLYKYDKIRKKILKIKRSKKSIRDINKVMKIRKRIFKFGGQLIIKKYPMATGTMNDIRTLLDELETFHNFVPDIMFNDYPDIMKDAAEVKDLNKIIMEHKGICDERGISIIAPSQLNDIPAARRLQLDLNHLSGLKAKSGHADFVFAIGQSEKMESDRQILFKILVARKGSNRKINKFIIGQNLCIGQFCAYTIPYKEAGQIINLDLGDDDE